MQNRIKAITAAKEQIASHGEGIVTPTLRVQIISGCRTQISPDATSVTVLSRYSASVGTPVPITRRAGFDVRYSAQPRVEASSGCHPFALLSRFVARSLRSAVSESSRRLLRGLRDQKISACRYRRAYRIDMDIAATHESGIGNPDKYTASYRRRLSNDQERRRAAFEPRVQNGIAGK